MLPESVRKQYLDAMGIQTWYDPFIQMPEIEARAPEPVMAPAAEIIPAVEPAPQPVAEKPVEPRGETQATSLKSFNDMIAQCSLCELHATRREAVAGIGGDTAPLMIISLAPIDEVGQDVLYTSSQKRMLEAMLAAIGLDFSGVYMTSLVKCQPPEQRAPYTSEMICCDDHLAAQIRLIQPKAILLMGEKVSQQLLVSQKTLTDLRLRNHQHMGVPVIASYHPADVTGSADIKRKVWQDLLHIKKQLA